MSFCNALLIGSAKTVLNKLQIVQNTAARLINKTPRYVSITPVLKELHWLPIHRRIDYKILTHVFKALHGEDPQYIRNFLTAYIPQRQLRSLHGPILLNVPRSRTVTYGDRCFSVAAPKLWNTLPSELRDC
jgi:hypothetical protein